MILGDALQRMVQIKKEREALKNQESVLIEENKELMTKAIAMMDEQGIDNFENDLGKITKKSNIRGVIENAIDFFFFLEKKNEEGLGMLQLDPTLIPPSVKKKIKTAEPGQVKLSIAWNRLSAYLKDACDPLDPKTWPPGVKVDFWEDVRVTVKK